MDIVQKKQDLLEDIARQPANVVFARIAICDEIQLADLMKIEFIPYLRGTAKSVSGSSSGDTADSLHQVCINLAKQRALLQGAAVSDVIHFKIDDGTAATRADGTATHNSTGNLTFSKLEDASYSSKTTFGYTAILSDSDVCDITAAGGTGGATVPQFIGDNEAAQSITVSGTSFTITGKTFTAANRTATLLIVGNETGGRVIVDITVNKISTGNAANTLLY